MMTNFKKWIVIKGYSGYDKVLCKYLGADGKPQKKFVKREDIGLRKSGFAIPILFNHYEGAIKYYQRLTETPKTREEVEQEVSDRKVAFKEANITMTW